MGQSFVAVVFIQGPASQAASDFLLFRWVDVLAFTNIDDDRLSGIAYGMQCLGLRFAQEGPWFIGSKDGFLSEVGQLDKVERKFLLPELAPFTDHGGEQV